MISEEFNIDYYSPYFMIKVDKEEYGIFDSSISLQIVESLNTPSMLSFSIDNSLKINNYSFKDVDIMLNSFKEGDEIESYIGYSNDYNKLKNPYFIGNIVGVSPNFSEGKFKLNIESYDHLHSLKKITPTSPDENKIYLEKGFDDIVKTIIKRNGLTEGKIDSVPFKKVTTTQIPDYSDYDLLNYLANRLGYEFFLRNKEFSFRKPGDFKNKQEDLTLKWGENLIDFSPRLSTANIIKKLTVKGSTQDKLAKPVESTVSIESNEIPDLDQKAEIIYTRPVENEDEAKSLAETLLFKHNSSFIEGTGECIGNPKLRPGINIKIQGIGEKFSGIYYVKNVTHSIGNGYKVSFGVRRGLSGNIRFD